MTVRRETCSGILGALAIVGTAAPAFAQIDAERCAALAGTEIEQADIGLPTTGATIESVDWVTDAEDLPAHCQVLGAIHPVDEQAWDIRFQVNLPEDWNNGAIQLGGGGYNGTLVTGLGRVPFDSGPPPLARGYVTLGSDSGHQGNDPVWLLNDEAVANFGGQQLKKTHDVANRLIADAYDRAPERFYFAGASQGGHEALTVAQRWPQDYDGIIVVHPAYNFTALQISGNNFAQSLYSGGAWISPVQTAALTQAVLDACDGQDGAEDGIISNPAACRASFDPAALLCEEGAVGAECLNERQVAALRVLDRALELPITLQGGLERFAHWPIFEGGDLTGLWGFGSRADAPNPAVPGEDAGLLALSDPLIRFGIMQDPEADTLTFEPERHLAAISRMSHLIDASDPNLSAFAARGGKMLLSHGTVDFAITPHNTIEYWERLNDMLGNDVRDFARFYMIPGFGHGGSGVGAGPFNARWPQLETLERWVEADEAPGALVAADANETTADRSRPLCEYGTFPSFTGEDVADAASFTCIEG